MCPMVHTQLILLEGKTTITKTTRTISQILLLPGSYKTLSNLLCLSCHAVHSVLGVFLFVQLQWVRPLHQLCFPIIQLKDYFTSSTAILFHVIPLAMPLHRTPHSKREGQTIKCIFKKRKFLFAGSRRWLPSAVSVYILPCCINFFSTIIHAVTLAIAASTCRASLLSIRDSSCLHSDSSPK